MHDVTFCHEILKALNEKLATLPKGHEIKAAKVSISPLSHVTPQTLTETFKVMSKDTPFSGIKLVISTLHLGIKCESCKKGFLADKPIFACPACHSQSLNLIYQKEFVVDSIDTATTPKTTPVRAPKRRPKKSR